MNGEKTIGIIAGAGPYAGLDLLTKILSQTDASRDQDHLTIMSLSGPGQIPDRTAYLLGDASTNPAEAIADQILLLEASGADIIGIPCNTAHAPPIFDTLRERLDQMGSSVLLLHMVQEVAHYLGQRHPLLARVGVLSTTGTYLARIYPENLSGFGLTVLVPDERTQTEEVHPAIYDPHYGIKASGRGTSRALEKLSTAARRLREQGAEAVILGCTEIPLAVQGSSLEGMPVVDATLVLARALVRAAAPEKLKRLDPSQT
jgi:aspartate racemase